MSDKLPRMAIKDIRSTEPDFAVAIEGCKVVKVDMLTAKKPPHKPFQKLTLDDDTGEIEALNFKDRVKVGDIIHVGGKVEVEEWKGNKQYTMMIDNMKASAYAPETRPDSGTDSPSLDMLVEVSKELLNRARNMVDTCLGGSTDTRDSEAGTWARTWFIKLDREHLLSTAIQPKEKKEPEQPTDLDF